VSALPPMTAPAWTHGYEQPDAPPLGEAVTVEGIRAAEDRQAATGLRTYLTSVHRFLCKYVAFPSEHEPIAVALWVAHSHLLDACDISPILAITSAEMRSGKTLIFDCIEFLVANPERMVTPSPAATYTALSERPRPTLLLDEADAIFTRKRKGDADTEGLRAVFNAGNRRGVTVARVEMQGKKRVLERLDVFGCKAIAGIGKLPETITDRSIVIRMRRKAPGDRVARFRYRNVEAEATAITHPDWESVPLVPDVPGLPEGMSDRAQDSWEPLLAIADAAGETWPSMSRVAAATLSAEDTASVSDGIRLLQDIKDVFPPPVTYVPGSVLTSLLHEIEESRWGDYYGSPLSARRLALLLEPYGIAPRQERVGEDHAPRRCYFKSDFEDAWKRYLVPPIRTGTSGTSGTDDVEADYPASAWSTEEDDR
jgi:hypothetical protein